MCCWMAGYHHYKEQPHGMSGWKRNRYYSLQGTYGERYCKNGETEKQMYEGGMELLWGQLDLVSLTPVVQYFAR